MRQYRVEAMIGRRSEVAVVEALPS